jgi:quinol monooxygenase YgiN
VIALVVEMKAKDGRAQDLERVMKALGEKVLANESGCELYQLARSKRDARSYVLLERYADSEALALHSGTDYFKAALPEMMACLDGAPKIAMYDEVG